MPASQIHNESFLNGTYRFTTVVGAAAGDVTVAGIKAGDLIKAVLDLTTPADRTAEFNQPTGAAPADNTINNTGGTSTAAKTLLVVYVALPKGML